jgi:hypothetical protein
MTRVEIHKSGNGAPRVVEAPTIQCAAERLMRVLDAVNPRFPIAPGMLAEIDDAKGGLRAALARYRAS